MDGALTSMWELRNVYKILARKPEGIGLVGRHRHRVKDSTTVRVCVWGLYSVN
jgi:hypothetical protein